MLAGWASPEASPLGLQMAVFSLCPHTVFPPPACVLMPLLASHVGLETAFQPNRLFKDLSSKHLTSEVLGVRPSTQVEGGQHSAHNRFCSVFESCLVDGHQPKGIAGGQRTWFSWFLSAV